MRNCLSDPKPEFTAALHYGFLQEARGEASSGRAHLLTAAAPASFTSTLVVSCPGLRGQGAGAAGAGGLPVVPQTRPPLPVCINSVDGGKKRDQISKREGEEMATDPGLALVRRHPFPRGPTSFPWVSRPLRWANMHLCQGPGASAGAEQMLDKCSLPSALAVGLPVVLKCHRSTPDSYLKSSGARGSTPWLC